MRKEHGLGTRSRFAVSGLVNTLAGLFAIFLFQILLNNASIANILGYLFGGAVGYFMHTRYTFRAEFSSNNFRIYALIWLTGIGLNLLVLNSLVGHVYPLVAQFLSVCVFVVYSYFLQSRFAYPGPSRRP